MQRVKDPERWIEQMYRDVRPGMGTRATREDLDRDADSFMAFAQAFGVQPRLPDPDQVIDVDSAEVESEG